MLVKSNSLAFTLDTKVIFYSLDKQQSVLKQIFTGFVNMQPCDTLDKKAFKAKVLSGLGYRYLTDNQGMLHLTCYDFAGIEDVHTVQVCEDDGSSKFFVLVSNVRKNKSSWWLREMILLEKPEDMEYSIENIGVADAIESDSQAESRASAGD